MTMWWSIKKFHKSIGLGKHLEFEFERHPICSIKDFDGVHTLNERFGVGFSPWVGDLSGSVIGRGWRMCMMCIIVWH